MMRRDQSSGRSGMRSGLTQAERNAAARRTRAHSHLERVRGRGPARGTGHGPGRAIYVLAAAFALGAGTMVGISMANGAEWLGEHEIDAIHVRGADHLSAADVVRATGVTPGTPPGDALPAAVERTLTNHAWIAEARAVRTPGGSLLLDVTESVPVGVVPVGTPARPYLVDATGTPFATAEPEQLATLPRIVVAGGAVPHEPSEPIAAALHLADSLPEYGLSRAIAVHVAAPDDPSGFTLRLEGSSRRVVLGREDLDTKLRELAQLLAADVPGVEQATEIDLRFADQAVLRNEPTRTGSAQAAATRGRAAPSI